MAAVVLSRGALYGVVPNRVALHRAVPRASAGVALVALARAAIAAPELPDAVPWLPGLDGCAPCVNVHVRMNGVAYTWRGVSAAAAPAALARTLGAGWRVASDGLGADTGSNEITGAQAGAWLVLTRRVGPLLHTLQLRAAPGGGSEGYWSALDPAAPLSRPAPPPLRLPDGALLDTTIEQLDEGARAVQFMGSSTLGARGLELALHSAADSAGWRSEATLGRGFGHGVGEGIARWVRGGQRLEIQVLPDARGARFLLNQHPAEGARP